MRYVSNLFSYNIALHPSQIFIFVLLALSQKCLPEFYIQVFNLAPLVWPSKSKPNFSTFEVGNCVLSSTTIDQNKMNFKT